MITEATAQRIAVALERILAHLAHPLRVVPPIPMMDATGRCSVCGGFHGASVMCPMLSPRAESEGR